MWNLLKSVFRSLKHNKVATIGLTFLVFLSTATFTVLNSTTTNINNEYGKIKREGSLHDFTVSELYNNSEPEYIFNLEKVNGPDGKPHWGQSTNTDKDGNITHDIIPWPYDVEKSGKVESRTWWYTLDTSKLDDSMPLKIFYEEHKTEESYKYIFYPLITIINPKEDTKFDYVTNSSVDRVSTDNSIKIYGEINANKDDANSVNEQINQIKQKLKNKINESFSPMSSYLNTQITDKKVLNFKKINSLNISNSQDKIYYKDIESNPTDQLDKVVLFNESFNGIGRNNFSNSDWDPLHGTNVDKSAIEGMNIADIASILTPEYDSVTEPKQRNQIIAKFILFSKGYCTQKKDGGDSSFHTLVSNLSTKEWGDTEFKKSYENWYLYWAPREFVDSNNFRLTVTYNRVDIPIWTIENWTSHFSVFAPSFLGKNNKQPLNIESSEHPLTSYKPFNDWYENQTSDIKNKTKWEQLKIFLNSCNQEQINGSEESEGFFQWLENQNSNSVVEIDDSIPMIIIGSGITPDYIYPIVSLDRPIPNPKEECVIFSNSSGYERLHTAYRGNDTEIYIVGKFGSGVNQNEVLSEINDEGHKILSWPGNIDCAYLADDIKNILNASAFRIAYIPSFVEKINTVDYFLTMFVVVLGILISLIVIRRYITNNRVNIGIIQANGIGKTKVGFSLTPFSLIPAIVGGVGGYTVGTLLQVFTLGLFAAYWVVPTPILGFSWIALVSSIAIPFVLFIVASLISTFFILREKTVNLMKYGSEFKTNPVARLASKAFTSFGVLTKFRISIAFNSIWKLFILCIMIAMTLSTFVFGLAVDNKFDKALTSTAESREYKYAIDLYSPTTQGGQYIPTDSNTFGRSGFQNYIGNAEEKVYVPSVLSSDSGWPASDMIRKSYYDASFPEYLKPLDKDIFFNKLKSDTDVNHGNVLIPMMADSNSLNWDLQYLKNKVSTKTVMDFEMGIGEVLANPWKIAKALMPDNAINQSNISTTKLIDEISRRVMETTDTTDPLFKFKDLFEVKDPKEPKTYVFKNEAVIETNGGTINSYFKVSDDSGAEIPGSFMDLLWEMYENQQFNSGTNGINNDYSINYGLVPIAKDDETYTYIDVTGKNKNKHNGFVTPDGTKILGIKAEKNGIQETKSGFVKLFDKNGNDLIEKLFFDKQLKTPKFPLVVNEYVAKKYKVRQGDQLSFVINNCADRFSKIISKNNQEKIITFDVVGINETFTGEEYFTNQEISNYILGLKSNVVAPGKVELPNTYIDFSEFKDMANMNIKNMDMIDLSDSKWNSDDKQSTPNGFNGIFTRHANGGRLLSNSISLYSPSGLWPGSDKLSSPTMVDTLRTSGAPNTWLASKISGFAATPFGEEINQAHDEWMAATKGSDAEDAAFQKMVDKAANLATEIANVYGQMAYVSLMSNVASATSNQIVFENMSTMIDTVEKIIIVVISVMVGLIVMMITSIIISDSKKMAGLLKALGYTDNENTITFLSIYLPVIVIGLLLAIPLSFGIISIFQTAIFYGAKILLSTTVEWWFFPVGILLVIGLMSITASLGYSSIRKERLVDLIK